MELAVAMLRPADDVLMVHTEASTEYVTPAGLEELRKRHTIQSQEVLIRKGEPGQFSGAELRRWGFVKRLASNRLEVVRALGLPAGAVAEDPSQGGQWRAVRIDLKGPIDAEKVDQIERLIQDEMPLRNEVNFVCLWIDSPGGPPTIACGWPSSSPDLDPAAVRTVAYIPSEARRRPPWWPWPATRSSCAPEAGPGRTGLAANVATTKSSLAVQTVREQLAPRRSAPGRSGRP